MKENMETKTMNFQVELGKLGYTARGSRADSHFRVCEEGNEKNVICKIKWSDLDSIISIEKKWEFILSKVKEKQYNNIKDNNVMSSNITIGKEAQEKFLSGIEQVSKVIRQSYGPRGANIAIEEEMYPYHRIVNDAQSIIQKIHIKDPVERRGLNFIKELSDKATKDSGEGRKTTIIIAEELLKRGFAANMDGMKLKEELDLLGTKVLESIDKQSKKIELEDIGKVAETSSRSKEIGEWIYKIYQEIGRDGIIEVEPSGMSETFYETTMGVRFKDAGWLSSYMSHGDKNKAVYEKPKILITRRRINNDSEIAPFMDALAKTGVKDLVIFTDDMDSGVASRMVATHMAKVMNILIIKAPVLFKNYIFEDFAKCTGADILSDESGTNYKNLVDQINKGLFRLGTCERLVTDAEDTLITGIQDIEEHKESLRVKGDNDSLLRLQWLNTSTAVLKLGADSESELSYKLLKTQDAISACRLALAEGVVEGGGESLAKVAQEIDEVFLEREKSEAEKIMVAALYEPQNQLEKNAGGDLNTEGVYDANIVIKNAVKNAISLAGIVLTTQGDIRLPEKSFEDKQLEILSKKQVQF